MELILILIALLVGVGLGAASYRAMLKRDPEKLERWAREIKAAAREL